MNLTAARQLLLQSHLRLPDLSTNTNNDANNNITDTTDTTNSIYKAKGTSDYDLITTSTHIESFIDTLANKQTHPCTIKSLSSKDVHAARDFTSKILKTSYSIPFFLQFLYAENCYCLVSYSTITKEITGVITGKLDPKSSNGHIYTLAVNSSYRRQGIATSLISAFQLKLASRTKILRSLWLEVLTSNSSAIDFYIYNQFFIDDSEFKKGFYNGVHDAYVMKKLFVLES